MLPMLPPLETSVFVIPGERVKIGDERLVVPNRIAKSVVDPARGIDDTHVFSYLDRPIRRILNTGWQQARRAAGLPQVRVHDFKHTFGRRLRAAGVGFEDRQDLLGHRSGRMTTHYSAAELHRLLEAANTVCERNGNRRSQKVTEPQSRKTHAKPNRDTRNGPITY
jgi:integrase